MGLREEIARVRQARAKLAVTRAKLEKLDAEHERIARHLARKPEEDTPRRRARRGFQID